LRQQLWDALAPLRSPQRRDQLPVKWVRPENIHLSLKFLGDVDEARGGELQSALQRAVQANHAKGGTVIVLDPHTGQILAMATYPWFDPNDYQASPEATWRNTAIDDVFEPGSVCKVITASAAVQTHADTLGQDLHYAWRTFRRVCLS